MSLETLAGDMTFGLIFLITILGVGSLGLQALAQRNVANTIELGVQGILGIDSMKAIDNSTDVRSREANSEDEEGSGGANN